MLWRCPVWQGQRAIMMPKIEQVDEDNIVERIFESRGNWKAVEHFPEKVIKTNEEAERARQRIH